MSVEAYQRDAIWFDGARKGVEADCWVAGRADSGSGAPRRHRRRKRALTGGRRRLSPLVLRPVATADGGAEQGSHRSSRHFLN
jgi:hypothetical protein